MTVRDEAVTGVVLLAAGVLVLSGCAAAGAGFGAGLRLASKDTITHEPEYQIGTQSIVVIPFRDKTRTHYQSEDGVDLGTTIAGELLTRGAAKNVVSDAEIPQVFAGQDLARVGWDRVGRQAGAQLLLTGDIEVFRLKDPNTIGLLRGYCKLNCFIYDVRKKAIVFTKRSIEVYVPEYGAGVAESDVNPERLRQALLASAALKVVKSFYKWEEKVGPKLPRY